MHFGFQICTFASAQCFISTQHSCRRSHLVLLWCVWFAFNSIANDVKCWLMSSQVFYLFVAAFFTRDCASSARRIAKHLYLISHLIADRQLNSLSKLVKMLEALLSLYSLFGSIRLLKYGFFRVIKVCRWKSTELSLVLSS